MAPSDPKDPRLTPIPSADLLALTQAATATREGVKAISAKLTEVAADARKASDGVIKLTGFSKDINRRVSTLEEAPAEHCLNEAVLAEHDQRLDNTERTSIEHGKAITAVEKEQAGLTKWRTWLTTITATVILALSGAAGKAIWDAATARATVTQNSEDIDALEKARQADRQELIKAVNQVPSKVKQVMPEPPAPPPGPTIDEVEGKMTRHQRRQLKRLLDEAGVKRR